MKLVTVGNNLGMTGVGVCTPLPLPGDVVVVGGSAVARFASRPFLPAILGANNANTDIGIEPERLTLFANFGVPPKEIVDGDTSILGNRTADFAIDNKMEPIAVFG